MSRPRIALIAALSRNGVIGRDNGLPWELPADMRHFRELTLGKPVLMGRKTFQSIGRALPGRRNIVVSRDPCFRAKDCLVVDSIAAGIAAAGESEELMIIGGAAIYRATLPLAQRMYLTMVQAEVEGDAYFVDFDQAEWRETARVDRDADGENALPYSFVTLERRERTGAKT